MLQDVRKLLLRLAIFAIPFALYAGVVVTIDPYEKFDDGGPISHDDKMAVSYKLNYALWKILAFDAEPAGHVLLGDSRVMALEAEAVSAITGRPAANMAYGGGSLREAIDTFWLIADRHDIGRVSFGLSFSLYNAANDKNRVAEVRSILDNPLLYFTNLNVIDAMGRLIKARITGKAPVIGKPPMDPDAFWNHQIGTTTRIFYESWRDPHVYRNELDAIADYCTVHSIQLEFFIPPGHTDLQETVARYGLEAEYDKFKNDLSTFGTVYDFDYPNDFTADRSNFRDPYHLTEDAERQVVEGVWGAGSTHVRILGEPRSPVTPNGD